MHDPLNCLLHGFPSFPVRDENVRKKLVALEVLLVEEHVALPASVFY